MQHVQSPNQNRLRTLKARLQNVLNFGVKVKITRNQFHHSVDELDPQLIRQFIGRLSVELAVQFVPPNHERHLELSQRRCPHWNRGLRQCQVFVKVRLFQRQLRDCRRISIAHRSKPIFAQFVQNFLRRPQAQAVRERLQSLEFGHPLFAVDHFGALAWLLFADNGTAFSFCESDRSNSSCSGRGNCVTKDSMSRKLIMAVTYANRWNRSRTISSAAAPTE